MKVEALVRWSELKFTGNNESEEAYLKRLVDGEEPKNKAEIFYEYSPMVFDTDDISRFNRSNDKEHTTLRFKDGDGYVIKYPYADFMEFYIESTGKTVTSLLPVEYLEAQMQEDIENMEDEEDEDEDDDLGL
jgi:hypothetical protein